MSNAVLFFDECETVFRSRLVLCPCTDNLSVPRNGVAHSLQYCRVGTEGATDC
jgi:hypothetical protein